MKQTFRPAGFEIQRDWRVESMMLEEYVFLLRDVANIEVLNPEVAGQDMLFGPGSYLGILLKHMDDRFGRMLQFSVIDGIA